MGKLTYSDSTISKDGGSSEDVKSRNDISLSGIRKCRRFVTAVTGLDPLPSGELREVQCLGEFGTSGRTRMMEIGRFVRDLYKLT